ncbi:hypothetical protein [Cylindrospermopsis raciborskii]|nr:hypothetical protein [Cylindrospermopsis raciborskii]
MNMGTGDRIALPWGDREAIQETAYSQLRRTVTLSAIAPISLVVRAIVINGWNIVIKVTRIAIVISWVSFLRFISWDG